jgi:hypothetical protein
VFQINLGITIINYALNKAWPNAEGPPPAWIRQLEFLPCDRGVCFFCDHGLTSGIVHKHKLENARVTVTHHKDNSTTVTTGHTPFHVNLQKGSSYCRQCLRKIRKTTEGKKLKSKEAQFQCNDSWMGCTTCDEQICDQCWDEGYWAHEGMQLLNDTV